LTRARSADPLDTWEDLVSKSLSVLGVVIAAAVLVVGLVSPAVGSSSGRSKQRDIRVHGVVTEVNAVDAAPAGASLGDQVVFSEKLLSGTTEVGHEGAVCTAVSVQRNEYLCVATFSFRDGQISAQGLVLFGNPAPYAAPITGGSGKYQGAAGELRVTPISATEGEQVLHLTGS
jgi:hypothetical protein